MDVVCSTGYLHKLSCLTTVVAPPKASHLARLSALTYLTCHKAQSCLRVPPFAECSAAAKCLRGIHLNPINALHYPNIYPEVSTSPRARATLPDASQSSKVPRLPFARYCSFYVAHWSDREAALMWYLILIISDPVRCSPDDTAGC